MKRRLQKAPGRAPPRAPPSTGLGPARPASPRPAAANPAAARKHPADPRPAAPPPGAGAQMGRRDRVRPGALSMGLLDLRWPLHYDRRAGGGARSRTRLACQAQRRRGFRAPRCRWARQARADFHLRFAGTGATAHLRPGRHLPRRCSPRALLRRMERDRQDPGARRSWCPKIEV